MKSILSLTKLLIQLSASLECNMSEVTQDIKDEAFAIIKKHLPDVDDATAKTIVEETASMVNSKMEKVTILPR